MIDIHSHIISGIDDGAKDLEVSLEMLKIAEEDGTKTIFATPHYYKGYFECEYSEVLKLTDELRSKALEESININILPGQEIFLTRETPIHYKEGRIGTLNGSKYMLLELPMDKMPDYAMDTIYELKLLGITPIIAHPERYLYIIKKPSLINQFIDEECLFQINSGSITGLFGKEVKNTSELLIKHGLLNFLGSDAHTSNKRCPGLKKSFDILRGFDKDYEKNLNENVENLIKNRDISYNNTKIKEKRSILGNIFKK